jgi:hypothetical protein
MDSFSMVKSLSFFLLLTTLFTYSAKAFPKGNLLLQCLAKEEESLHKKKAPSALYRLNQEFVNELASSNDINVKKVYVDEICQSKIYSPSIGLLRLLLIKEHELYDLSLSGVDANMRPFKMAYINEFQKQVPRMFIQYVAGLQSELAGPKCLDQAVPELVGFNEKVKYLEEIITTHQLIANKNTFDVIFKKLNGFAKIKADCAKVAKKEYDRKKLKSPEIVKGPSTAPIARPSSRPEVSNDESSSSSISEGSSDGSSSDETEASLEEEDSMDEAE